jgi:glycosyltransferase involved in cell wall biosynthesis
MPKVSVIISTYNRAHFLSEALESVLSQDYSDFELLVVDDGSDDETYNVIKPYLSQIGYIWQENRGVSSARNLGIGLARGEYIAFLDSDDLWKREKLRVQVRFMEERGFSVSYTEEIWIRKGVLVNPKKRHKKFSGRIFEKVLPLCLISPSSMMVRREVFEKIGLFDESLPVCEDYEFGIRLAKSYEIGLIEERLIVKRGGHPDQLSKRYWGMDRFRVKALEKVLNGDLTLNQKAEVLKVLKEKCRILAEGAKKRGKTEIANMYQSIPFKYQNTT